MIKVCFIYDPESNERFLEIILKMTPDRSGCYKNIQGVTRIEDADYCVVIDDTVKDVPLDKTIFLQAHPDTIRNFSGRGYAVYCKNEHTFGEWWIDADYSQLKNFVYKERSKKLCCIISDAHSVPGHIARRVFLEKLCAKYPDKIDVYGRIVPMREEPNIAKCYKGLAGPSFNLKTYWFGKDAILTQYQYSLELEALVAPNYFSERIYDALLLGTKPISWGCPNLEDWFPKGSYASIDIYKPGSEDEVIALIENTPTQSDIDAVTTARELCLDTYQLWAKVHDIINGGRI